jgi:hypothetical protein
LLHRHYSVSPLLRTHPSPSRRSPISRCRRLYGSLLRRFRDGARRVSPVARHILVIVLSLLPRQSVPPHRSDCDGPCCLRSMIESSASGVMLSRPPPRSLSLRPDDSLTIPGMALSIDFQDLVSFLLTIQATGPLTLALAGLTPAEYTSLTLDIQSCSPFRFLPAFATRFETNRSPWLTRYVSSPTGGPARRCC